MKPSAFGNLLVSKLLPAREKTGMAFLQNNDAKGILT